MGDLDPVKVKEAVVKGLKPVELRAAALKNKNVSAAWNQFAAGSTASLLRGEITIDEWKSALGQLGGIIVQSSTTTDQQQALAEINEAAKLVEEAFSPPSPLTWLIFLGVAATGLAYWWHKRQESKKTLPAATPDLLFGSRRKVAIPAIEDEEEEAEFEEL